MKHFEWIIYALQNGSIKVVPPKIDKSEEALPVFFSSSPATEINLKLASDSISGVHVINRLSA